MRAERRRESASLLVSLLVHALLLSLIVGGQGTGLPGLGLPWQQRRAEIPDVSVVLAPAALPAPLAEPEPEPATELTEATEASEQSPAAPPPPAEPAVLPERPLLTMDKPAAWAVAPRASAPMLAAPAASSPLTEMAKLGDTASRELGELEQRKREDEALKRQQELAAQREAARAEAARVEALRAEAERKEAERKEAERREQARAEAARVDAERRESARQDALKQEAARAEAARLEAERQEAARQLARQEAARAEAAKQETARQEAARQEAARQEAARQESARAEAARAEAARQEAARAEAGRQEAARAEAARQDAARAEAARLEGLRQDAARLAAAKAEAARAAEAAREERLRAIGRQLNEEADRRSAGHGNLRRGRLFGRTDTNAEMALYGETWARRIELNQTFDMVREALPKTPFTDPLVTVAMRADGSIESITFVRSSGVPALDAAVRRVIESQANYPPFQPALAREYDVIEIRRSWRFDSAIRLY